MSVIEWFIGCFIDNTGDHMIILLKKLTVYNDKITIITLLCLHTNKTLFILCKIRLCGFPTQIVRAGHMIKTN